MSERDDDAVKLPSMGEGVFEATIVKWLKKPGDVVTKDEPLLEVSTDKVDTEIIAPTSGFLIKTFADVGKIVHVDELIAQVSKDKNAAELAFEASPSQENPGVNKNNTPTAPGWAQPPLGQTIPTSGHQLYPERQLAGRVRSSPLTRKMAKELGIPLAHVQGSGLHGRITKSDLQGFLAQNSQPPAQPVAQAPESKQLKTQTVDGKEYLDGVLIKREPMSKIRALTAAHMLDSIRTSPHVTTTFQVNMHRVSEYRKEHKLCFQKDGLNLTYTAFFIEACKEALKEFPAINASVDGKEILFKESINIACAVATKQGLMVPVLRDLGSSKLQDIVTQLNGLTDKARDKQLSPADIKGGTFTVTNPGVYGSLHSQPIINQPQVAILSIGALLPTAQLMDDGSIEFHPICQIGLTFDHRIIDGEQGSLFLQFVQKFLENYSICR